MGNGRNPFRFGPVASGDAFTDREDELRTLLADVRNGQDVVVFAPRRFGKTSLVRRAAESLALDGSLVAQIDLMRTPTKVKLAEKLARTIHDDLATPLLRAKERLQVFTGLRVTPTVTVDPENGALSFAFTAGRDAQDVDETLEALFELPARLAAERKRQVTLVLDEFQEVVEIDPRLPRLMRAVFQHQPDVAHVYLGSRRHLMERLFTDENEPFWRSAKPLDLGTIPVPAFAAFLGAHFAESGRPVPSATIDRLLERTGGHPSATQQLAYALWEQPAGDLDAALTEVIRSEHAHFTVLWEGASRTKRLLLQALAAEQPARPLTTAYARRHDLPATATIQTALAGLVGDELVGRLDDGSYEIREPFLTEWIRREES